MNYSFQEIPSDLGPSPMGPSHTKNTTCEPIQSYLDQLHGSVYSIDNLRFRLSSSPARMQAIMDALDRYDAGTDDVVTYSQGKHIGGYRWMWQWRFPAECDDAKPDEKTSVVIGYALVKGNGATDEGTGFIEFNPNKIKHAGFSLLNYLEMLDVRHTLVKYDLAIDYPISRDKLRLLKDGRKYGCEISDSMTEYLGQRNKPGRIKLYDKAAERGYIGSNTRVELTCDGVWKASQVISQLPTVYSYSVNLYRTFNGVTLAFALAVQALVRNGDSLEPWLRLVNPKTRAKIHSAFTKGFKLHYDETVIYELVKTVQNI